jgi:acetyltransferase
MSIRNLDSLFQPQSLALIGASDKPNSLGTLILKNLKAGGFTGLIGLVNPNYSFIHEDCVWPTVSALPFTPDLAIICTPAHSIPSLIDELGRKGCRAAIVISTGLNAMVGGEIKF